MPTFKKYKESPLYAGIEQLLANLETIRKNPPDSADESQEEKTSLIYLNHLYKTVTVLHREILPMYSEGNSPGWLKIFRLMEFKELASQLKKNTNPVITTALDCEIVHALMTFVESLPDTSLFRIAPFLNVSKIPSVGQTYVDKFFGIALFGQQTTLQKELSAKKQSLQDYIDTFERQVESVASFTENDDSRPNPPHQPVRPPMSSVGLTFFVQRRAFYARTNTMDTTIKSVSPSSSYGP